MTKRFATTVVVAMVAMAALATTAQAFPTKTSACSGCHTKSTSVTVSAVQTANDGVRATYSVSVTGTGPLKGWAVLSGSTNLARATAGTGTFTVPVGKTYTVWGVSKTAAAMPYSNSISISPVAPVVAPPTPASVPTPTPQPTVTPGPSVTPAIASTASLRMHFKHHQRASVKLTDVATGTQYVGVVSHKHTQVTFKNLPDGTYTLTVKYPHHRTKTIGTYSVSAGKIVKVVPPKADDEHEDED